MKAAWETGCGKWLCTGAGLWEHGMAAKVPSALDPGFKNS